MDDQAIRDEVLEAEGIIRGLALRMQEANAALEAAEAARRSLTEARGALDGSSAQMDNLSRTATEAIRRAEEAAQALVRRADESFRGLTAELARDAQNLRELRAEMGAAAQQTAQTARTIGEIRGDMEQALGTALPTRLAAATANAAATLSQEVARAREAGEGLQLLLVQARTELRESLGKQGETLEELRRESQKMSAALDAAFVNLSNRLQESRVKAATQTAALESSVMERVEHTDTRVTWIIVLQVVLSVLTVASGLAVVKLLLR
jgi:chromosome segregation ATPase